jgi:hypothetical protein
MSDEGPLMARSGLKPIIQPILPSQKRFSSHCPYDAYRQEHTPAALS